jgi:hypothetical protein
VTFVLVVLLLVLLLVLASPGEDERIGRLTVHFARQRSRPFQAVSASSQVRVRSSEFRVLNSEL